MLIDKLSFYFYHVNIHYFKYIHFYILINLGIKSNNAFSFMNDLALPYLLRGRLLDISREDRL